MYCDPDVTKELKRLQTTASYQLKNTYLYDVYFVNSTSKQPYAELKIVYLNINGLCRSDHINCLRSDRNLPSADILYIAETCLTPNDESHAVEIEGFTIIERQDHTNSVTSKERMGMLVYARDSHITTHFNESQKWQCISCKTEAGMMCFVYVHPKMNLHEFQGFITYMSKLNDENTDFLGIIGDLNLHSKVGKQPENKLIDLCSAINISTSFSKKTHECGNQLDYILLKQDFPYGFLAGSYFNMYSDHSAVFIRLILDENSV